jgi:rhodanese-related sulfurtransferase
VKTKLFHYLASGSRPERGGVWLEALVVLGVGIVFALVANLVSPRGLVLTRNYSPGSGRRPVPAATNAAGTNLPAPSPAGLLAARLREQGLQLVDGRQAQQLFRDPRLQQGTLVFIDARDEELYRAGHIPGAWEFDPYRPEKYFPAVHPLCLAAEQVVVYCNGGDCDDSEFAALTLRDVGIATNKLFIYEGGLAEWATNGLPVETGDRNSGKLLPAKK